MSLLSHKTDSNSKDSIHDISTDVAHEFKNFVYDIESLMKESASLTGDELAQVKVKLNQRINTAKQRVNSASVSIFERARKTATATNEYVHEKPWGIIGAGALASFVLGVLVGYRKESKSK